MTISNQPALELGESFRQFTFQLYVDGRLSRKGTRETLPSFFRGKDIPEGSTLRIHTECEFAKWFFLRAGKWELLNPAQSPL